MKDLKIFVIPFFFAMGMYEHEKEKSSFYKYIIS